MPGATRTAVAARVTGAVVLATAALLTLQTGGVSLPAAVLGGAGALTFALWRTIAGVGAGYALLLAAAGWSWSPHDSSGALAPLLVPLVLLELFGLATVVAVARSRDPRRVSRRLLGVWLASSGLIVLGLSLSASLPQRDVGSALVAAGLAWRLGVVPLYAWAPLLLRHPARLITTLGIVATLAAGAVLLFALPRLPHPAAAATTVAVLSAATVPWALWHALRQWRRDRHCSLTYAGVVAVSELVLLMVSRSRS